MDYYTLYQNPYYNLTAADLRGFGSDPKSYGQALLNSNKRKRK
jgi:hypothetical protein